MCFVVNLLTLTKLHTWWYLMVLLGGTRGTCTAFTGVVHNCTLIHYTFSSVHPHLFIYIHT
jgi:hypothetical protein